MTTRKCYTYIREAWKHEDDPDIILQKQILNVLNYTKTSKSAYAAPDYPAGYHTIELNGVKYPGLRSPASRFKDIAINFEGKTLLDIGCNQGGMIFHLKNQLKYAIGIDFDPNMINACNLLKQLAPELEANFFVIDLDKDPHELIREFIPGGFVDIVFLLSVCKWIKSWRELIKFCSQICHTMVFEVNGSNRREQIDEIQSQFTRVEFLREGVITKVSKRASKPLLLAVK